MPNSTQVVPSPRAATTGSRTSWPVLTNLRFRPSNPDTRSVQPQPLRMPTLRTEPTSVPIGWTGATSRLGRSPSRRFCEVSGLLSECLRHSSGEVSSASPILQALTGNSARPAHLVAHSDRLVLELHSPECGLSAFWRTQRLHISKWTDHWCGRNTRRFTVRQRRNQNQQQVRP